MRNRIWSSALVVLTVAGGVTVLPAVTGAPTDSLVTAQDRAPEGSGPILGTPTSPSLSEPLRDLPPSGPAAVTVETSPRRNPLASETDGGARGTWNRQETPLDPLINIGRELSAARSPELGLSFEGIGNPVACSGCTPPDTNGDVGPNHYVQMVNATKVQIWDKAGTSLVGPFDLGSLWSTGVCTGNRGDPIALYDPLADRWLLTQFAEPNHMCFAVSLTGDATGSYWLYQFDVSEFPDYFKIGVWPDGYYMSANESTYTAYVFDRAAMLSGAAANYQKFDGETNFLLPSDVDGPTPPPAGTPNHFYTFKDNSFHGGADRIEVHDFHVDWGTPANTTFDLVASLPVAPFTYTACGFFNLECLRQPGTAQRVDQVGEWPMWRWPYRNFGTHESMVGTFAVGGGAGDVGSAVRWFELRSVGGAAWTLHQEGTHDLADGLDRWMSSIAMDRAGNIALGYSASSSSSAPSIRYATRRAGDPLGTLGSEIVMQAGLGSQTSSNRWGDYSAMTVDPSDDCTFWFTTEYYAATSGSTWSSRIGNFVEPSCATAQAPVAVDAAFEVAEDAGAGTTIGTVSASDANMDPLTFAITSGNVGGAFSIDASSGELVVQGPLDFATTPSYLLAILVSDGGLADIANVTIDILAVNEAPQAEDGTFAVPESASAGEVVGRMVATDPDGDAVTYSIDSGNTGGAFAIDSATGDIAVAGPLDFESTPSFELAVTVSDGPLSDTATATINVVDVFEIPAVARFEDVPSDNTFFADVEWLAWAGITVGCNPPTNDEFCPGGSVTRAQMAAFIVRALGLTEGADADLYTDDNASVFEADINKLGTSGITKSCNPPTADQYCPSDTVTRAQMAAFLHRAEDEINIIRLAASLEPLGN